MTLFLRCTLCVLATSILALGAEPPKPIFEGPVLTSTSELRLADIDVSVKGAKELYLVVSDEGADSCDWSDWLEPKLVMADGSMKSLTELAWKTAVAGHGKVAIGKSYGGTALKVAEQTFNGIGTHAASTIVYDLPEGVERFKARVAIDDGGMIRAGKPSDAKVRFYVYTEKPAAPTAGEPGPPLVPTTMFTVPEGLEVTLWATSPMLFNPTNIDFDAEGRLYVAEGVNYRGKGGRRKEGDRIVVLEDTTGSGVADKSTVFVQDPNLAAPLGVAVFENKVIVSQPPDMLVYTDVDRNGVYDPKVDRHDVLLTGF
ncbi:MAG: hypothetical protein JWM88_3420, partial [Verrucomicrobia bacterium]|nr:hypothetical protein [Verrucomicrobiota bacterium]